MDFLVLRLIAGYDLSVRRQELYGARVALTGLTGAPDGAAGSCAVFVAGSGLGVFRGGCVGVFGCGVGVFGRGVGVFGCAFVGVSSSLVSALSLFSAPYGCFPFARFVEPSTI